MSVLVDNKKKNFAISSLRRASLRWKPRNLAKNKGRKQFLVETKTKKGQISTRMIWHYQCVVCGPDVWHRDKDIELDHTIPVVSASEGWQGFDVFIDRLYCEEEGFQLLCTVHHLEKSLLEGTVRTKSRRSRKK